jgi:polar amino acid transport system substrate-binding protein
MTSNLTGLATASASAPQAPDARVQDLVRAGKLRAAVFLPQFSKSVVTGEIQADVHLVEPAQALAARIGVALVLVDYATPSKAVEGLNAGSCDVAFLGIDPSRATEVGFSPPFVELDYTYLVPAGSTIFNIADADRPEVRIAAIRNHASTIALSRLLKHATSVHVDTPDPALDLLRTGRADAVASVTYALEQFSTEISGSRVLEDRYGANRLAMAVPKAATARLAYINEFIEEAKATGLIQRAIERGGLRGVHVAPNGNPE